MYSAATGDNVSELFSPGRGYYLDFIKLSGGHHIALGRHEDLYFPASPAHASTAAEVIYPFCLLVLPVQEVKNEKIWRFEPPYIRTCTYCIH